MNMILALSLLALATSPGKERWQVKIMPEDIGDELHLSVKDMLQMSPIPGITKSDHRYEESRIPNSLEGRIASISGYLRLVAWEPDGDYHIQISDTTTSTRCVIVEIPNPEYVKNKILQVRVKKARETIDGILKKKPSFSGTLITEPIIVYIKGIMFYDDAHVGTPPRGKKGMTAPSLWELHPAYRIKEIEPE